MAYLANLWLICDSICAGPGLRIGKGWCAILLWLCHYSADGTREGVDVPAVKEAGKRYSMDCVAFLLQHLHLMLMSAMQTVFELHAVFNHTQHLWNHMQADDCEMLMPAVHRL